jgi:hypothetical protein
MKPGSTLPSDWRIAPSPATAPSSASPLRGLSGVPLLARADLALIVPSADLTNRSRLDGSQATSLRHSHADTTSYRDSLNFQFNFQPVKTRAPSHRQMMGVQRHF